MFSKGRGALNLAPCQRWLLGLGLAICGMLLVATPGGAGILDASWAAPTTNADGSPLTDLASYRVYYGVSAAPCPGPSFFAVTSSTPSPAPSQTETLRLTGLSTGTLYNVSVTAVNTSANESACSTPASALSRIDFAVIPTGTVDFGTVNLGSFVDQTFTVSNTGGGTVSGSAFTSAPFSIVSGSPFSLVGVGTTQAVIVRFSPTTAATATANVNFTADGDTISRLVTGTAPNPVPALSALTPSSATAGGAGFTLTVSGSNFVAASAVQWNGTSRPTTFLSSTQLTAAIAAADIAIAGTAQVTVFSPAPGGGTSAAVTFTITASNPVPALSALTPSSATAGGAGFTLTVSGSNFVAASAVQWNGTSRPTTFLSSTQLQAAIAAADIATAGTPAVSVLNPAPGGGLSNALTFTTLTGLSINAGLVGYWAFDDGSGTTAVDSSGNGNTGTLVNGPTWTAGKLNQALSFDGLIAYVNVPHTTALNAYPLTVAVWIKTNTTTGVRGIVNKYVAGSTNGYQVFLNNGTLCAWYLRDASNYVYDGTACTLSTPGYADNQWHQVVFVVDGAGGRLYVDGFQKATLGWTGTTGAPTTTQPVHIADYAGAPGGLFSGLIDDVRIYNRALSSTEVSNLYGSFTLTPDTTPPAQSAITASLIGVSGATISWTTNEASTTQVEYGPTTAYGSSTPLDTSLVTSHSKKLDGLASGTTYHLRVKARDAAGNLAVSSDSTFKTADPPPGKKHKKEWFDGLLDSFKGMF